MRAPLDPELLSGGFPLHIRGFDLEYAESDAWTLTEAIPGHRDAQLSVSTLLMQHKEDPGLVIRLEITEAPSEALAEQVVRGYARGNKAGHRLREFRAEDRGHASEMVRNARLAFVDVYGEHFNALVFAHANLAIRAESVGEEEVDLDDLGELRPDLLFRNALAHAPEHACRVEMVPEKETAGPGETVALEVRASGQGAGGLWYLFAADDREGAFFRDGESVLFRLPDRPGRERVTFYLAAFDPALRRTFAAPRTIGVTS